MIQQIIVVLCISVNALGLPNPRILAKENYYNKFSFVTRDEWNARRPARTTALSAPVELVIIHHSYEPGACFSTEECSTAMRSMQNYHQLFNGWDDIGYNFAVGSDGQVYEGRGWTNVGAHAAGFNTRSIGIVLIGDWISVLPPKMQLDATKLLIETGVELGYISPEYKLLGHRQVRATECPGDALYQEITTWDRYSTVA